jgi:hypothetical protein
MLWVRTKNSEWLACENCSWRNDASSIIMHFFMSDLCGPEKMNDAHRKNVHRGTVYRGFTVVWNTLYPPCSALFPSPPPLLSCLLFSYPAPTIFADHGITVPSRYFQDLYFKSVITVAVARSIGAARWTFWWLGTVRWVCVFKLSLASFCKFLYWMFFLVYSSLTDSLGLYMYLLSGPTSWSDRHVLIYLCCIICYCLLRHWPL